jgi:hypothetical protein
MPDNQVVGLSFEGIEGLEYGLARKISPIQVHDVELVVEVRLHRFGKLREGVFVAEADPAKLFILHIRHQYEVQLL